MWLAVFSLRIVYNVLLFRSLNSLFVVVLRPYLMDECEVWWLCLDDYKRLLDCEREHAEAIEDGYDDRINASVKRLSWVLVHSRQPEDMKRGIAMLEAALTSSPLQKRKTLYLLAVGYYRSGDYPSSVHYLDRCLEIAPNWEEALSLKKTVEKQFIKDGLLGLGVVATVGVIAAGGIAAVGGIAAAGGIAAGVVVRRGLIMAATGIVAVSAIATSASLARRNTPV